MLTVEGSDVAVLAGAETDVNLVVEGDWDTRNLGDNGDRGDSGSGSATGGREVADDGRRFASDGNSSSDDGGDAEELHDGQHCKTRWMMDDG